MSLAFLRLVPTLPGRPLGQGGGCWEGGATGPPSGPVSLSAMTCQAPPVLNASQASPEPARPPQRGAAARPRAARSDRRGLSLAEGHGHLVGDGAGIGPWVCMAPAPML